MQQGQLSEFFSLYLVKEGLKKRLVSEKYKIFFNKNKGI